MSVIIRGAIKLYYYLNEDIIDDKTKNWFLIGSPWPGLGMLAVYLLLVTKCIPEFMKNRPAYDLRRTIACYNILQIIGCAYVFYQSMILGWFNNYKLICQPVGNGEADVIFAGKVCYSYFLLKVFDLLDTIFFAFRKKQNQISFLHVYHHFGMVAVSWGLVKWVPGGHATFMITLNSFVHIIMYTYYLLTILDDSYKQSVWWKKYVTQIQLIQFMALFVHFVLLVFAKDCGFPKEPAYILIPQNLFMVILFGDFYYRTYIKSPKKEEVLNGKLK
ncbi:hypothetical protein K1T71_010869 [Dendrolimus kikuchii]|uniref:Uncharacterized protein n=1 Tax=Dendrolimus kikuchii TaxID=765133 RepID=A0ACC1CQ30_9NEOP|nr:hypothetical protein K1T71_010869 [Dendrolimus kikuchii]